MTSHDIIRNLCIGLNKAVFQARYEAAGSFDRFECDRCGEEADDTLHNQFGPGSVVCHDCAEELCAEDDRRENEQIWDAAGR